MAVPFVVFQAQFVKIVQTCSRSKSLQKCPYMLLPQISAYLQQTARMSQYDKRHLPPILDKEELAKELPENDLRRHRPIKAAVTDDSVSPLFYDQEIQKFTNIMMKDSKKERVREIMLKLFENLKHMQVERYHKAETEKERSEIECRPTVLFKQAVENCKPLLMPKRVVKGGIAYKVPVSASTKQQQFRAMKWLIESCRDKERRIPMEDKLAMEILDACNHKGKAIRRKQEIHKICESNRAYAHLQ